MNTSLTPGDAVRQGVSPYAFRQETASRRRPGIPAKPTGAGSLPSGGARSGQALITPAATPASLRLPAQAGGFLANLSWIRPAEYA